VSPTFLAERHDLIVISDEIYDRLVYGVEHTCFPALPGVWERTILLQGFSKSYAMTGWRIGYAAAPAEILEAMHKVHQYLIRRLVRRHRGGAGEDGTVRQETWLIQSSHPPIPLPFPRSDEMIRRSAAGKAKSSSSSGRTQRQSAQPRACGWPDR
jgi:hypothetical protein